MNPGLRADSDWEQSVVATAKWVNGVFRLTGESFFLQRRTSPKHASTLIAVGNLGFVSAARWFTQLRVERVQQAIHSSRKMSVPIQVAASDLRLFL